MNRLIFTIPIFILFIIFINVYAQDTGEWEILNQGGSYRSIDFINDQVGWVAGGATLSKTEDGGEIWDLVEMDSEWDITNLYFLNETIGWAQTNSYQIIKTMDGGHTWFIQKELNFNNEDDMEMALHAVNGTILYASVWDNGSDLSRIIKTVNGGTTWNDISPYSHSRVFNSIWFQDTQKGLFLGSTTYTSNNLWYEPFQGTILKTNDGGNTWDETIVPEFSSMYDLQFINDSTAYFLADEYFLCKTTDTLNSWSVVYELPYHQNSSINSFYCLDNSTIFAMMTDTTWTTNLMKSSDGGLTWEIQINMRMTGGGENKIYFRNADVGFILQVHYYVSSFLLKTINGGNDWKSINFSYPVYGICFIDKNKGFTFGGGAGGRGSARWGDMFVSTDSGNSWEEVPNCPPGKIIKCFFIDALTGFSLSDIYLGFSIFTTTDGGANWTEVYESDIQSPEGYFQGNEIMFLNQDIGWVVGSASWSNDSSGAAILGTNDGGDNWDIVWKYPNSDEHSYNLNSIHTVNNDVWAVGESGLIVKSVGSDSFMVVNSNTYLPLNDVFFSDGQHGWIGGGFLDDQDFQSILLKTINGGTTWSEISFDKYLINDMYFADSLHGWAVGNDTSNSGMILWTNDGGNNWVVQLEGLIAPLHSIHFKDGYGWAVGFNGLILRTDDGATWIDQKTGKTYPDRYTLKQNYPNPFNPTTLIEFSIPKTEYVTLKVYNLLGQEVAILVSDKLTAGNYKYTWDASQYASGVYYYKLEAASFIQTKKLILMK